MLDIKFIRDNKEAVKKGLAAKNSKTDLEGLLTLDKEKKDLQIKLDDLRSRKNIANDEISKILKDKKDPKTKIAAMKSVSDEISRLDPLVKELEKKIDAILMNVPNVPHVSVPAGNADKNKIVREWGTRPKFSFKPKTHLEIAEHLDIIDFKRAAKISGSNFIVYKKDGARLERALINFMLDRHTQKHGYTEIFPPFLVNRAAMTGTGQLPKMEEDMYRLKDDDLFLIPTAEVPVTNLYADEILSEDNLPIYHTAYTACFRREAGSYGKDTKGLMRVHQFDKVELVKFVKPETSYDELEKLVADAEDILQSLGLPYRVVILATGDLSFASAKTYDLECYACGLEKWLEVSSCSSFEDFQARRAGIRFKSSKDKKTNFIHTLNGSGVALARTVNAIIENCQTKEGSVVIPEVLRPYLGGQDKIAK